MNDLVSFGNLQGSTGLLAEQEMRAALAICAGLSSKEAARVLGRSPSTVKKTVERIFFKLGVSNRAALVAEAFKRGLIAFACNMTPPPQHQEQESTNGVLIA
ncbi:response regulator transcription factor [Pseudomonas syringae]|uniref:DNA-binding response regulator n=1 Tax=Pseudomonas syringae pv. syringae TaxID=321 RepID=A0AAE5VU33_PSESY|nr:LuxR C-terminal-related transcriptional regulator [Pseudomonas syringae]POQ03664.1 DNA-binding response regulator [Pseudomonas syringae pv. syringae]